MADPIITEDLREKWNPIIQKDDESVKGLTREDITVRMLENQEDWCNRYLNEASAAPGNVNAGVATWSPVLIKMVKRMAPNLMAFDMFGVQPMSGPDGQIFAMRARYASQTGAEAFVGEADTDFSGAGTHAGDSSGFAADEFASGDPAAADTTGTGMATADAEALGSATGNAWGKMAMSVEKTSVTAKSRGLYADYSHELRQDMMAIHGENVDNILSDILVTEILAEMNREFIRSMNISAKLASVGLTNAGELDISADTDGRWMIEKWKGILFQLELEANAIAKATRRGKGNFAVCSSNVAAALVMAGVFDAGGFNGGHGVVGGPAVDDMGMTTIGTMKNGMRLIIDPYATIDYITVGFKGSSELDAGIFYCPYTPLEQYRAQGEDTFSPRIAFKTRYGLVANPYVYQDADGNAQAGGGLGQKENDYYKKCRVVNFI